MQVINLCAICPKDTSQEDIVDACNFHVHTLIGKQLDLKLPTPPKNCVKITVYSDIPEIKSRHIKVNLTVCPIDEEEPS